jgi:hypothetical protein
MNFTFLVILSLLTLGFTYETLNISQQSMCVIILVLVIFIISYNIKEKFNNNDDEEKTNYLLFNSKFITMLRNFFNKDYKNQVIKNRNIGAEIVDLELPNNM